MTVKRRRDAAADKPGLEVQGYLSADQMQRVEVVGTFDPGSSHWVISGTVDGLEISPELRAALPEPISQSMEVLASLRRRPT